MSLDLDNSTCPDGYQLIYKSALFSHECVTTPLQLAAVIIGFSSVICWVFAQAPQIIKNWRSGDADTSFSVFFLFEWALGDAFNLIGAIFAHQLAFQIWQAAYFCLMDCVLCAQFIIARARKKGHLVCNTRSINDAPSVLGVPNLSTSSPRNTVYIFICVAALCPMGASYLSGNSQPFNYGPGGVGGGRRLLSHDEHGGDKSYSVFLPSQSRDALIGYILGSISAFFYIVAGFPQAFKNYRRKSCKGLSKAMFWFAALGNITYALGVFLFSTNTMFLLNKLPWIVGSVGSLAYQFTVLTQFYIYKRSKKGAADERKPLADNDYAQRVDYTHITV